MLFPWYEHCNKTSTSAMTCSDVNLLKKYSYSLLLWKGGTRKVIICSMLFWIFVQFLFGVQPWKSFPLSPFAAKHDIPLVHCGTCWSWSSSHCYGKLPNTLLLIWIANTFWFSLRISCSISILSLNAIMKI